jgi:hypothetical protein
MKIQHHPPAVVFRRRHRIRQQRKDRSELVLLRAVFAAVCEFDPVIAGHLNGGIKDKQGVQTGVQNAS